MTTIVAAEAGAATFPYKAYVVSNQARVRGGPGQAYPVTGYLAFGSEVDVYRDDPGGWCAIRPPEGSYSWVLADAAQLLPNGLAKVVRPGVPSYVGGAEVPDRSLSHVTLQEGELLEVLDVRRNEGDSPGGVSAAQTWLKIRPPSGEFRWIHVSSLRAEGNGEPLPPAALAPELPLQSQIPPRSAHDYEPAVSFGSGLAEEMGFAGPPSQLKPQRIPTVPIPRDAVPGTETGGTANTAAMAESASASANAAVEPHPIAAAYDAPADNGVDKKGSEVLATSGILSADAAVSGWRPMTGPMDTTGYVRERPAAYGSEYGVPASGLRFSQPVVPGRRITPLTPEEFARQAQSLELDLATRLTEPPEAWNPADLRQRAADLQAAAPDAEARDRAAKIAQKVAQAEQIAAQWRGLAGAGTPRQAGVAAGTAMPPSSVPQAAVPVQPAMPGMPLPPPPVGERPTRIAPPPTAIAVATVPSQGIAPPVRSDGADFGNVIRASAASGAADTRITSLAAPIGGTAAQPAAGSRPVPTREEIARELLEMRRQRFDAIGRLIRAQVRRPGDPPYALTDEDGRILAYVQPSPGTIMRSYVGRTVGVMGKFSGSGATRLLTAEHVAVLDSGRPTPAPRPATDESPVRFAESPARSPVR
ncbi:MAG: SH3 domain-containing protein [Thermogutta sp.]